MPLICEDFVFDWAYNKISNSLDIQQFGNIRVTSTSYYLISFLDFIQSPRQTKHLFSSRFVDFRKAFDLVDHSCHQQSPRLAGFLTGRQQAVRYQNYISSFQQLTHGVPKGTKMSPLCFLILINDAITNTTHHWKYINDCTVGLPIDNKNPEYSALQAKLEQLQQWTEESKMTINHTKTVVMHVYTLVAVPLPSSPWALIPSKWFGRPSYLGSQWMTS
ncbi:hypothetical protein E2C01_023962 [Portunus trituberculatus]|uniref:Reverse transcriptase domain-containing protein n=1 Tax=Portunus trituberculatus TaxID=210409 RepID=A0A5B7E9G6_PORTR|nr:hypothetical protein [Portunus trituberculatus]